MSTRRFLLVDDHEHHLIGRVLDDAQDGHPAARAWGPAPGPEVWTVHGLADAGHLLEIPRDPEHRGWLVEQLRALTETADPGGRVLGWIPAWFAEQIAVRIEDEHAPAGEPGSVRVGAEDLRALLDAATVTVARPEVRADERAELDALADVVERVGTLAAMVWTEPGR